MSTWHALLHPLSQSGSALYGGIGSDFGELTLVAGVVMLYRKHKCHVEHCHRLAWHPHPDHDHPVCKHHHPDRVLP